MSALHAWLGLTGCLASIALAAWSAAAEPTGQGGYVEAGRFSLHKGPVQALAVARDGRLVASVGDDRLCYVIDAATWRQARRLGPHRAALRTVAFAASGNVIVGGERDAATGTSVVVWDARSGRAVAQWNASPKGVLALAVAGDDSKVAAAHGDGGSSVWYVKTNETDEIDPPGKGSRRSCAAFSPDGRYLLLGDRDGHVYRWTVGSERRQRKSSGRIRPAGGGVLSVSYAPDGGHLATGHSDGTVRIWLGEGGKRDGEWAGHAGDVRSVAYAPDGKLLVSAGADGTLRVWDTASGELKWLVSGHAGAVTAAAFVGSGQQIASCGVDGTVRLWRYSAAASSGVRTAHAGKPNGKDGEGSTRWKSSGRRASLAVPPTDQVAAAAKLIREVFAAEYAAAIEPAGKEKLAARLLAQGREQDNKPAERFAALDAARQLAVEAGAVSAAVEATEEIIGWFRVDALALRFDTVSRLVKSVRTSEARTEVAEAAVELIEAALASDRLEVAEELVQTADNLARSARKPDIQRRLRALRGQIQSAAGQRAAYRAALERLKAEPDDPAANLVVGRRLAFDRGEWAQGLSHLAKGSDPELKKVADLDLAGPDAPEKQADLAEAWEALAASSSGNQRLACLAAAEHWYRRAMEQLSGLRKLKVQKALEKIGAAEAIPDYLRR